MAAFLPGSPAAFFPEVPLSQLPATAFGIVDSPALSSEALSRLKLRLADIAQNRSSFYGCSIAIGMQTGSAALAVADRDTNAVSDRFVWGSVTKLLTGSAVLRAVERGDLASLDTRVAPLIDPILDRLGLGSLEQLFGWLARFLTARHLGAMKSGVPDYDTAKPWPKPPTDPLRKMCYQDPEHEWDPAELLNVSWVAVGKLNTIPGLVKRYSSTNFVLLGLLLAAVRKVPRWDQLDQAEVSTRPLGAPPHAGWRCHPEP